MEKAQEVVVVVVPFPAHGHLSQLLHLSRLLSSYHIPVHTFGTTTHHRQATLRVHGWDPVSTPNIYIHEYDHTPQIESPSHHPNSTKNFPPILISSFHASSNLRKPFAQLLAKLSPTARRVIVIHDGLMSTVVQDVVSFPNAEAYVFHCASAFQLFSYLWEDKGRPCIDDYESHMQLTKIPTRDDCMSMDFIEIVISEAELCKKFNSGNLHDACKVIESKFIDLLSQEEVWGSRTHWAMGPFNPVTIVHDKVNPSKRHMSLEWLDKQDQDSVLYVSFGTTTSLSNEQIQELAFGLENSGQKFIWVVRNADKVDIFKGEDKKVKLPKGFEERVKEKGLVVRDWAPQLEILAHPSTGGFMSHCGWNSSIESITMGVPIAAWPMHSDQPRNASLLTQVLNVAISVMDWEHRCELVTSTTIAKTTQRLMASNEGDEMRRRALKLSHDVKQSVEPGGVTRKEIGSFVAHITR